jgi:predicted dehydrogenase
MIHVGIAGIGFMGVTHFTSWGQVPGAKVTAISTRNPKRLAGDWSDIKGNFGDSGGVQDLSGISRHQEIQGLLNDEAVDLIDLCLPTPLHPQWAIAAMEAGKHVVVEKPIALTVAEADRMIEAAQRTGRLLFVAQVLRFWPQWTFLKQAVESGRFGSLTALNLKRIISVPTWTRDFGASGGPLIDLHIHDVDFILYLLGKPDAVSSSGLCRQGVVTYASSLYHYEGGAVVSCQSGCAAVRARPFQHQFEAYFEKATVTHAQATEPAGVDACRGQSGNQVLTVYHEDGSVSFPDLPGRDAFTAQLQHVADCVAANRDSDIIGAASARDALHVTHLEAKAIADRCLVVT